MQGKSSCMEPEIKIQICKWILIGSQSSADGLHTIKSMKNKIYESYYAPLTLSGNIIVIQFIVVVMRQQSYLATNGWN